MTPSVPGPVPGPVPGRRGRLALAVAAGVALTLTQPPLSLWPLALVAVPVLVWLIAGAPGRAGWTGFAAGTAHFATGLYWITEAFLVDIARHGWMAPFALAGMAAGLALFWVLPFWLTGRARLGLAGTAVALAGLWTLSDFARAHVLTGFPWALTGYVWVETPVAQGAALAGPHALGFLTLLAGGLLAAAPRPGWGRVAAAGGIAALGALWIWGAARLEAPVPQRPDGYTLRLVQPNAPQHEKWRPDLVNLFFRRQLALTAAPPGLAETPALPMTAAAAEATAARAPDLVIWPETAIPWFLDEDARLRGMIAEAAAGRPVVLGARRVSGADWFNALFLLGPEAEIAAAYDKHHLVPFGEYVPLHGVLGRLGLGSLTGGRFTPGAGPQVIAEAGVPPFLPLICYEAIFPHQMQAGTRPDWMVQITNDAWFGSSAGPYQHFAQARMRAIEQGLPLARAANTGISGVIGPMGRVIARQALLTAGHVDAALPAPLPPTLYARTGDLPWMALVLALTVTAITTRRRSVWRALRKSSSQS